MKMTGAGAGELWYEEWLGLQFRIILKDNGCINIWELIRDRTN